MVGQPAILAEGASTDTDTTYTTNPVTPTGGGVVLLVAASGARATLGQSAPVAEVTGGAEWVEVGNATSSNDRVTVSVYAATADGFTSGSLTVTFNAPQETFTYRVVHIPDGTAGRAGVDGGGSFDPGVSIPDVPADAGTFAALVYNSTSMTLNNAGEYEPVGSALTFSRPSGTLTTLWALPGVSDTLLELSGNVGRGLVVVEIAAAPEPVSSGVFLVVDGVELAATVSVVVDGVEVPATVSA